MTSTLQRSLQLFHSTLSRRQIVQFAQEDEEEDHAPSEDYSNQKQNGDGIRFNYERFRL